MLLRASKGFFALLGASWCFIVLHGGRSVSHSLMFIRMLRSVKLQRIGQRHHHEDKSSVLRRNRTLFETTSEAKKSVKKPPMIDRPTRRKVGLMDGLPVKLDSNDGQR